MDNQGYVEKYKIERLDGKPLGRTFTIEIDKDPQARELLNAISEVYKETRPVLSEELKEIANTLKND